MRNNDIRTKDLRNNEIRGLDIRNSTVQGRDVALATLTGRGHQGVDAQPRCRARTRAGRRRRPWTRCA